MTYTKNRVTISCLALISGMALLSFSIPPVRTALGNGVPGFAVVELFTSEGCSSCPPADELVAKIQQENNEMPVYILAFHVDYWNKLGWRDIFSEPIYSNRQNQYSKWLNASVYTPQVVVNGQQEFVGSDENKLRSSIRAALHRVSPGYLKLSDLKKNSRNVTLHYQIEGNAANSYLVLALIEKTASSKVLKGENQGRTLMHVQIVRKIQAIRINELKEGVGELEIPEGLDRQKLEIIAFLQSGNKGEITAATRAAVNN